MIETSFFELLKAFILIKQYTHVLPSRNNQTKNLNENPSQTNLKLVGY